MRNSVFLTAALGALMLLAVLSCGGKKKSVNGPSTPDGDGGTTGEVKTFTLANDATMEMVRIEPGTFTMGTTEDQEQLLRNKGWWYDWYENEHPAHQVTLSKGFYLGKYEITQGQWEAVMGNKPWSGDSYAQEGPSNPAVDISWNDVQEFVRKLNQVAGEEVYRLPTEAEWEYACRAGTNTLWSFGDEESQLKDYMWYYDNAWNAGLQYAQPVGKLLPNRWGLYDMHGNVWEWVQDWYGAYSSSSQTDPTGSATGAYRVGRGGDFNDSIQNARSEVRDGNSSVYRGLSLGARLLRIK